MNVNGNFYLFIYFNFLIYFRHNILSHYSYITLFSFFITAAVKCVEDSDCPKYYCMPLFKPRCSLGWCICVFKNRMNSYN
uniref:Nodule-specific cysteine-rich peptide G33 n=1 Tax=Pisum sativum TaxID=3888 RepID=A0A7T8DV96_PEA|nr:nodule-specific cysteine-rich peptide G33 [Pisum sativum]